MFLAVNTVKRERHVHIAESDAHLKFMVSPISSSTTDGMVECHGCESTLEGGEEASELPFISLFGTSLPLLMSPPPTQLLFTQQNDFQRTHVYLLQPGSGSEIYCL